MKQAEPPAPRPERRTPPPPAEPATPPETAEHPVPGVKHRPEPDAENLIPAEHEPGTL